MSKWNTLSKVLQFGPMGLIPEKRKMSGELIFALLFLVILQTVVKNFLFFLLTILALILALAGHYNESNLKTLSPVFILFFFGFNFSLRTVEFISLNSAIGAGSSFFEDKISPLTVPIVTYDKLTCGDVDAILQNYNSYFSIGHSPELFEQFIQDTLARASYYTYPAYKDHPCQELEYSFRTLIVNCIQLFGSESDMCTIDTLQQRIQVIQNTVFLNLIIHFSLLLILFLFFYSMDPKFILITPLIFSSISIILLLELAFPTILCPLSACTKYQESIHAKYGLSIVDEGPIWPLSSDIIKGTQFWASCAFLILALLVYGFFLTRRNQYTQS